MSTPYRTFWPEECELSPTYSLIIPKWRILEEQSIAMRNALLKAEAEGQEVPTIAEMTPHRRHYGTLPPFMPIKDFDLHNLHCFQYLPSTYAERERIVAAVAASLRRRVPEDHLKDMKHQVRNEMMHSMYHHAMWRRYGRKVFVLDEVTYSLLAQTPLPNLPASLLAMPTHSFYLVFPRTRSFQFGVWNVHTNSEDLQQAEGVLVSMDNITPDSNRPRELAFMTVGEGKAIDDRNIAFISVGLGPDARLSDIRFKDAAESVSITDGKHGIIRDDGFANRMNRGSYELGVMLPRIILGFLLYLQSEHPDIEPVEPAPRRNFHEIKSPKQREAAQRNQAEKLRGTTRLPIYYVGRHLREELEDEKRRIELQINSELDKIRTPTGSENLTKHWTLDHPVWVTGHFKMQAYGEGRQQRRMIWIRPYLKGPDVAEVIKARAAKVQRAQNSKSPVMEVR